LGCAIRAVLNFKRASSQRDNLEKQKTVTEIDGI